MDPNTLPVMQRHSMIVLNVLFILATSISSCSFLFHFLLLAHEYLNTEVQMPATPYAKCM